MGIDSFSRCAATWLLPAVFLSGCAIISGDAYVPVSSSSKKILTGEGGRSLLPIAPLVFSEDDSDVKVFVAAFDGTFNDKDRERPEEQPTVVANLYQRLRPEIRAGVDKHYEPGPGMHSEFPNYLDALLGYSARSTAENAYGKLLASCRLYSRPPKELRVVAIGFSRGAATARHFLNLVFRGAVSGDLCLPPESAWSYAVLFDTVDAIPFDNLDFDLPPNFEFGVHIVAKNEARFFFSEVVDEDRWFERQPYADLPFGPAHRRRMWKIPVPGSHSDIGDSYQTGAGAFVTYLASRVLWDMGLLATLSLNLGDHLEQGLHDSRGWIDKMLFVPLPYSCGFERRKRHPPVESDADAKDSQTLYARKEKRQFERRVGMIYEEHLNTEHLRFLARPDENRWSRNDSVTNVGEVVMDEKGTAILKVVGGTSSGAEIPLPAAVLRAVKASGGGTLDVIVGQGRFWYYLDGCMPEGL